MPTEITVTGCGDCPMYRRNWSDHHICMADLEQTPPQRTMHQLNKLCTLPTDSITIKLKQDETHKTDVRGGER